MKCFLALTLLMVACTDDSVLSHTITIDHNLSDNQIEMAESAIEEWRQATGCYTLAGKMQHTQKHLDAFCPDIEIGHVDLWQPFAIKKVKEIEGDSGTAAMAHWYDSWIIVDSDYDGKVFKQAVMHELSHYLDLHYNQHEKYSDPVSPIIDAIVPNDDMHTTDPCDLMAAVFNLKKCHANPTITTEHLNAFKERWID